MLLCEKLSFEVAVSVSLDVFYPTDTNLLPSPGSGSFLFFYSRLWSLVETIAYYLLFCLCWFLLQKLGRSLLDYETMVYGWRKKRTIFPQKNWESWRWMYIDFVCVHVPQNWPENCLCLNGCRLWRALIAHRLKDIHEPQLILTAKDQYNFKSHKFKDTE